jgi:hypothetical protein
VATENEHAPLPSSEQALLDSMSDTLTDAATALKLGRGVADFEAAKAARFDRDYKRLYKRVEQFITFACLFPDAPAWRCMEEFLRDE